MKWFNKFPEQEVFERNLEIIREEDCTIRHDYHQTILNIGYEWLQRVENKNMSYLNMIDYMAETYGEIFAGFILVGKYNQQVCNGGHFQYYDNGYASGEMNFRNYNFNHPLHQRMIKWFIKINRNNASLPEWYNNFLLILKDFMNCNIDTDKTYTESEWIQDEEDENDLGHREFFEADNENYGQIDTDCTNKLDERYYEISDSVMDFFEIMATKLFNDNRNELIDLLDI